MTPNALEAICRGYDDDVLAEPISDQDYERLLYVRRSGKEFAEGSDEGQGWQRLFCRFRNHFPTTPERVAWHEAGHAVVACKLGWDVVQIFRDTAGWPKTCVQKRYSTPHVPQHDEAMECVAGWVAEARQLSAWTDPTREVADLARTLKTDAGRPMTLDERVAYIKHAEACARSILDANWESVRKVAALAVSMPVERKALLEALASVIPGGMPRYGRRTT